MGGGVEKADYKRLEHLGRTEEDLLKVQKLYIDTSSDLRLQISRNQNLRDQNEARKPLPQQVPVKSLLKAIPKVHLVGVEDRIKGALALAKDSAQGAVFTVFQSIYQAKEPTCALVARRCATGDEQVESGKALGMEATRELDAGCYQNLLERSRKEKGTLAKKYAV